MAERDLTNLEHLDRLSRKQWSIACAEALIQSQSTEVLVAIAAAGLQEFIRVSKPIYHGHMFRYEDFVRMFDRITYAAANRDRLLKAH